MIKKYYTHYISKKEAKLSKRFNEPIEVYKSEEIDLKLRMLVKELTNSRRTMLDTIKDFEINLNQEEVVQKIKKIEISLAEVQRKTFSDFE